MLFHELCRYDIARKEKDKSAIWLEAASDLNTAESRIEELTSFWPGEFQIMDQQNHQIVEKIISPSDRDQGVKRQIVPTLQNAEPSNQAWLDIDRIAWVEVTSEEAGYPIESALLAERSGWRAADLGIQRIRVMFREPQRLRRIWLVSEDTENTRTQEFVLQWLPVAGHSFREIVRQQWNFSSPDSVREIEYYIVELSDVHVLELLILPDKRDSEARASLLSFRLA